MTNGCAGRGVVDVVRVTARGGTVFCETIAVGRGLLVPFGCRYRPVGIAPEQVHAEIAVQMRGLWEQMACTLPETKTEAERRLKRMAVDLEVGLTGLQL